MEGCQFPYTYTTISGLLDDENNSKQQNYELCHSCSKQAKYCLIRFDRNMNPCNTFYNLYNELKRVYIL